MAFNKCLVLIEVFIFLVLVKTITEAREIRRIGRTNTITLDHFEDENDRSLLVYRNPCGGITHYDGIHGIAYVENNFNTTISSQINHALQFLKKIENADPHTQECDGFELTSLPPVTPITELLAEQRLDDIFKFGQSLRAHLKIMVSDRKTDAGYTRFGPTTCGDEQENLVVLYQDMEKSIENILCAVSLQPPFGSTSSRHQSSISAAVEQLSKVQIQRFNSNCSRMPVRDCLVIQGLHRFLHSNWQKAYKGSFEYNSGASGLLNLLIK